MMLTSLSVSLVSYIWLCYVSRLFFKQRKSAPIAIIFYLLALIPLDLIITAVSGAMIDQLSDQVPRDNVTRLIEHFLVAAILVPYFSRSKRVKATFTADV